MWSNLKFILKHLSKRHLLLQGYGAMILECVCPLAAVMLQRDLIDQVFKNKDYSQFTKLLGLYLIFFFAPKLFFTLRKVSFFELSYNLQRNLSRTFLEKVHTLPASQLTTESIGKLQHHLRTTISDVSDLSINQLLSELAFVCLNTLLLTVALISINPLLTLGVALIATIYYALARHYSSETKLLAMQTRKARGEVSKTLEETIASLREQVAFNRQKWQIDRYDQAYGTYYESSLKENAYKIKVILTSEPFLYGTKLFVLILGIGGVMTGRLTAGTLVVAFTLADQLITSLGQLFQLSMTGKRLSASIVELHSVIDLESESFGNESLDQIHSLVIQEVVFQYTQDSKVVIDHLSLDIPIGKKIAIVGSSGSGKSTVAQLMVRMYQGQQGEVLINNKPIHDYGQTLANKVSIVFQQPYFLPGTIMDNMIFNEIYDHHDLIKISRAMDCHDFIENLPLKYETEVGERAVRLSGGQKQRIALARALLKNPEVLILDEATSALDPDMQGRVQENIDLLRRGKTTIVIAHRLSTIINAELIYVMDQGKVIATGTHDHLMNDCSLYQSLYVNQQTG